MRHMKRIGQTFWGSLTITLIALSTMAAEPSADIAQAEGATAQTDAPQVSTDKSVVRPTHRNFNLHFAGGFFTALEDLAEKEQTFGKIGGQAGVGLDIVLKEPLALSILGGFNATAGNDGEDGLRSMFLGIGFMLRFTNDENGALFDGGTAAGSLWLDAHFDYVSHNSADYGGYNVGLGYEFALWKDVNMGPYVRLHHAAFGDDLTFLSLAAGIQISVGGRTGPDDSDNDGVLDEADGCPKIAEDIDNFRDEDGCPDEDNDEDGILDAEDQCPLTAGVSEENGCPVTDNDKDNIENDKDKCPDQAEDMDDFEDADGCPDTDNDGDKVVDEADKCPMEAEDIDGYEDADGCPDIDNDNDGVLDADDQCPMDGETKNEIDDSDGCPDFIRVDDKQIVLLKPVDFEIKKETLTESAKTVLDEIASLMVSRKIALLRVEVHTASGKAKTNLALSQKRAETIETYLGEKGIDTSTIAAQGKGQSQPLSDGKTAEEKAKNERVEFFIGGAKTSETPADAAPTGAVKAKGGKINLKAVKEAKAEKEENKAEKKEAGADKYSEK